jgi:branched-chain amino acid transport system ATP-binding protein
MTESWRISYSIRTLRRIWWALPFLAGGYSSFVNYLGVYFDRVHHLGTIARGDLIAAVQPFTLAGLAVAAVVGTRLMSTRPSRLITYVGLVGVAQALSLGLVALAPTWWLAVVPLYLGTFAGAILEPALFSLLTLVIPPRVRGAALGWAVLFAGPGLLIGPVMGRIGETLGPRWGVAGAIPFFLVGALIIVSAGASVDADLRNARAAAAAASAAAAVGDEAAGNLLVVRDLDVHYGSVQILFGVDLDVAQGEILALLGTNGAGKSTLLRAIAGTVVPSAGAVFFDGDDITHLPPAVHAKRGIAQVQGGNGVFPGLTVAENLDLAKWGLDADDDAVDEALRLFPVLQERADQPAGSLSGGEQQMLALAQAFLARPKLLVIDELSLGLSPAVVEQLLEVVRAIHAAGTTVVLVEQSINVAFSIAQRAVFMEKGQVRFDGDTRELLDRPDILRAVFLAGGATAAAGSYGSRRRDTDDREPGVALEVRGLSKAFGGIRATNDVSFALHEGQILGLIGPNGAGKTTLFDLIGGFTTPDEGEVLLLDEDITALPTHLRAKAGLHRSFQDARLFPALTVTEAISIALERHLQTKSALLAGLHLPMVRKAERKVALRAERVLDLLGLGVHRDKFLRELSTGTRRLVDLACVVATEPKVLLLDEPSAGVAQKETEELGPILERIRYEVGCAILLIEHDMPLISAVSDELLALEQGAVVTRGTPTDVLNHPRVIAAYLGNDESAIFRSGAPVRA